MAVMGCGQSMDAAPNNLVAAGAGINLSGRWQNPPTRVSADGAAGWIPFTPVCTNFTLGNAAVQCRYLPNINAVPHGPGVVDILIAIRFGSTSTFTGTKWTINVPAPLNAAINPSNLFTDHDMIGDWSAFDVASAQYYEGRTVITNNLGTLLAFRFGDDLGGVSDFVRDGAFMTFNAGDEFCATARFEIAP